MADSNSSFFLVNVGSASLDRFAKISPQDAELILRYRWKVTSTTHGRGNTIFYAYTSSGGRGVKKIKMHRLIMNAPEGVPVDHINGDGLDNRRDNLRLVTAQLNQANSRKYAAARSKFKGVAWSQPTGKWRAYINVGRKQTHLGLFLNEIEAARAYDAKAREVFGDYAFTNL